MDKIPNLEHNPYFYVLQSMKTLSEQKFLFKHSVVRK
ncbi:hypothetical protein T4C_13057 [Trichinella pseudospiralis]|uniref:Uncharacterized protein n=1 Tax=Trichinella pseudospiralis TaxID=6337 RepID=A0A0V1GI76_TRIPS|nr:hypothetical protein T4C_13057 [Trichinella pseudospiralis]